MKFVMKSVYEVPVLASFDSVVSNTKATALRIFEPVKLKGQLIYDFEI
jgi:hypothetical protein